MTRGSCCDNCVFNLVIMNTSHCEILLNTTVVLQRFLLTLRVRAPCSSTAEVRITTICYGDSTLRVFRKLYTMTRCRAPNKVSMTSALPKSRLHTTMKYEHEHRSDLKTPVREGTTQTSHVVVSSLKEDSSTSTYKPPKFQVQAISVLT